ncbi:hypothetical protein [Pseudohalioglobus lutimaris]|uniref:Uncharacterized protein n=1 Tax=Pseudohalioglobus lutimaris TaxID=1737061 RepID=A0A2N5X476_9GAMM|nr:hypothetical protein [Pseudohalioglobus lutimaris]PLW69272.1 hypothetical protein C0039_09455 [Pseudohalioglobus lutimaris]
MLLTSGSATAASLITGCCGLVALRYSWRQPGTVQRLISLAGWVLLASTVYFASLAWGSEFGISYALAGFTLAALVLVAVNTERRPPKPEGAAIGTRISTSAARKLLTFLAAGPCAGAASCQLTLATINVLPVSEINGMAAAALLFPVLWGIMAYISVAVGRPARYAMGFAAIFLVSSAVIYLPGY